MLVPAFHVLIILLGVTATVSCAVPTLRKVHTELLGQLTGTARNPSEHLGITGTDLGVSFVDPETHRLIFLFGDSWSKNYARIAQDSAAWTRSFVSPDRDQLPEIHWFADNGEFIPVTIPDTDLRGMNVPVEGLAMQGKTYLFASTGWDSTRRRHCCSVLAHTDRAWPDGLANMVRDHIVQSDKFINISAFAEEETVWIFGSGAYRSSAVYLAKAQQSQITDRNSWQYYRGMRDGRPEFGTGEVGAQPVVPARCAGEISVRKHPELGYLMLYNCNTDGFLAQGVYLARADHPWGPWDPPINVFHPSVDRGYGFFLHEKPSLVGYDDGLAEPSLHPVCRDCPCDGERSASHEFEWREECQGGMYGPYLVPEWFSTMPDGGHSIVYTLSSWVPYQVHLIRTIVAKRDDFAPQAPQRRSGTDLTRSRPANPDFGEGLHKWQSIGDPFLIFQDSDGRHCLTTSTRKNGNEATGAFFQDITVDDAASVLGFWVHGGDAAIRLYRGQDIIRETRGRSGHEPRTSPETKVCWRLSDYAGETLRLAVVDDKTEDWGFIGVRSFQFLRDCSEIK
jgi:hypothetical protein